MKKSIKLLSVLLLCFCLLLTGCGKKKEVNDKDLNRAEKISNVFVEELKKSKDLEKIMKNVSESKFIEIDVETFDVKKGDYLSGFKSEIKGFDKAVGIRPMIGSIPFIAYAFEVKDSDEFTKKLQDNFDLRWNICTQADYMDIVTSGKYVFFVMTPDKF